MFATYVCLCLKIIKVLTDTNYHIHHTCIHLIHLLFCLCIMCVYEHGHTHQGMCVEFRRNLWGFWGQVLGIRLSSMSFNDLRCFAYPDVFGKF